MKYLQFIGADRLPTPDELVVLQREAPRWVEEMAGRGVRLLGRELDLPQTTATVRARGGETLVSDGPFAETKEFIAGFDLLECADLDEAIEVAARHPCSWFQAAEIRPVTGGLQLGDKAAAFAAGDDSAGIPYLLTRWLGATPAAVPAEQPVPGDDEAWRQDLRARGLHVLGGTLAGPEAATTVRVRDGKTLLADGPFIPATEFIAGLDVVSCAGRPQAIQLAAAHPIARSYAIEVRGFVSE
jgi:hypothetical protein